MHTQDMVPSWAPQDIVPKDKHIAKDDAVGRVNKEYALDRLSNTKESNLNCLSEMGPGFLCGLSRMSSGLKVQSRQEGPNVCMSTSSKSSSTDPAPTRKYFDLNKMDLNGKNHFTCVESNRDCSNLSGSSLLCGSHAITEKRDQMDPLFEQIKANCLCDPRLLEKVIVWSRHHDNSN